MRAGSTTLAAAIAWLGFLALPLSAQVVQITPDQAALRVRYEMGTSFDRAGRGAALKAEARLPGRTP